jgi:ribosomal-protein-alanine N-acetyltransferase
MSTGDAAETGLPGRPVAGAGNRTDVSDAGFVLQGRRVRVRDFRVTDLDAVAAIAGHERVTRWLSFDARDREGSERMLGAAVASARARPRTEYYLAVVPADDERVVGFVRLALGGVKAGKLGYAIHAAHWDHGYATDAVGTLIGFGFTTLDLHRITAAVGPDNQASIHVLDRLGFALEGRQRDHVFTNGAWRDSLLYSLLQHDHDRRQAPPEAPAGV